MYVNFYALLFHHDNKGFQQHRLPFSCCEFDQVVRAAVEDRSGCTKSVEFEQYLVQFRRLSGRA